MQKPSVGRIVHYQSYGSKGGEYASECRAAIITQVNGSDFVGLAVLNPTGLFFHEDVELHEGEEVHTYDLSGDVLPDRLYRGGTWHWPERIGE